MILYMTKLKYIFFGLKNIVLILLTKGEKAFIQGDNMNKKMFLRITERLFKYLAVK